MVSHVLPPATIQVMTKFLWSHITPWLRKDIHVVTHVREKFETSPFIAVHVRRGDKIDELGLRFKRDVKVITTGTLAYVENGQTLSHSAPWLCAKRVVFQQGGQHDYYVSTLNRSTCPPYDGMLRFSSGLLGGSSALPRTKT